MRHCMRKKEQKSLEKLKQREDIFITNTDKGGVVFILDVNDSIKESERRLNDTKH